jgi:predicted alpha/beta-fold hydrolase
LQPFHPLIRNPHLLTIFGNFARRTLDTVQFPIDEQLIETEPGIQILVHSQRPAGEVRGELILLHGLEGSSNAGYLRSMAQLALTNGYAVHRTNMRSCGGTDEHCRTMYHAGLTSDTLAIVRRVRSQTNVPLFLGGYSLGGNVVLKLAGELGEGARGLLAGVVAVSTPIDLAACVRALSRNGNRLYEWRFVRALKARIRRRGGSADKLRRIRTVYEFDDAFVAPFFGFGTADRYYATQSAINFLPEIRVPTLLVQAKDDPMIPFDIFSDPRLQQNPNIRLLAVEHGGHLGFIASAAPQFWVDRVILNWIAEIGNK